MKSFWLCAALAVLCLAPWCRLMTRPSRSPNPLKFPTASRPSSTSSFAPRSTAKGRSTSSSIPAPRPCSSRPEAAKKAGVEPDAKGWGVFDEFEIEGGVVLTKAKGRVEKPFQLEGMNGLGLAGVELHGMIGYNILARYRMEIDFTKDKMVWTPLDYKPVEPEGHRRQGRRSGGLEIMGTLMKFLGVLAGRQAGAGLYAARLPRRRIGR